MFLVLKAVRSRRSAVGAAVAVGILMLAGSVAYACIPWKGEMTVTPLSSPTPPTGAPLTVHADPTDDQPAWTGHLRWCDFHEPYPAVLLGPLDTFRIDVRPYVAANYPGTTCPNSQLHEDTYTVTWAEEMFVNADLSTNSAGEPTYSDTENVWGCHNVPIGVKDPVATVLLGTFDVDSKGTGSKNNIQVPSVAAEAAGICITSDTPNPQTGKHEGHMAPVSSI